MVVDEEETVRVAEDDLRILLKYATPELTASPQWMRQIRRRVVRRRRRRLALLTAVTGVGAVALAVGTLTGAGVLDPGPQRPARLPAAVGTVGASSSPGGAGTDTEKDADDLGLVMPLPAGWQRLSTSDARSLVTIFIGNGQRLTGSTCDEPTRDPFTCAPVSRLGAGEALMVLRQEDQPYNWSWRKTFTVRPADQVDDGCRAIGGYKELMGWGAAPEPAVKRPVINAYVCLRGPSSSTLAQVEDILDDAVLPAVPSAEPDGYPHH
ncbi:hypothetical protein [Streptomyces sp. NBC_00370]|uniref:hypothetical protein n=1 Tax=Streptomyces sp. NBC_00370 TaxID=2975728 RepID=UPI002E26EDA8